MRIKKIVFWWAAAALITQAAVAQGAGENKAAGLTRRWFLVGTGAALTLGGRGSLGGSGAVAGSVSPAAVEISSAWRAGRIADWARMPFSLPTNFSSHSLQQKLMAAISADPNPGLGPNGEVTRARSEKLSELTGKLKTLEGDVLRFRLTQLEALLPSRLGWDAEVARDFMDVLLLPSPGLSIEAYERLETQVGASQVAAFQEFVRESFPDLVFRTMTSLAGEFTRFRSAEERFGWLVVGPPSTGKSNLVSSYWFLSDAERALYNRRLAFPPALRAGWQDQTARDVNAVLRKANDFFLGRMLFQRDEVVSPELKDEIFARIQEDPEFQGRFSLRILRLIVDRGAYGPLPAVSLGPLANPKALPVSVLIEYVRRVSWLESQGNFSKIETLIATDFLSEPLWPEVAITGPTPTEEALGQWSETLAAGRWPEDLRVEIRSLGLASPPLTQVFGSESIALRGADLFPSPGDSIPEPPRADRPQAAPGPPTTATQMMSNEVVAPPGPLLPSLRGRGGSKASLVNWVRDWMRPLSAGAKLEADPSVPTLDLRIASAEPLKIPIGSMPSWCEERVFKGSESSREESSGQGRADERPHPQSPEDFTETKGE